MSVDTPDPSRLFRLALPAIAVAQPLAGALHALTGLGVSIGERAREEGIPPELPLGPFFSIWSVIFLAYGVFAIYAAMKDEPLARRLAPPLALAGLGNIAWMLQAQLLGVVWLDVALLFAVAAPAWIAAERFDRMRGMGGSTMKFIADAASGLLAGWISVAIAISIPRLWRAAMGWGVSDGVWPMTWLALAAAAVGAWLLTRRTRSVWPFVAIGWGLTGVALNNFLRTEMGFLGWAVAAAGAAILLLRWTRSARGAAPPKRTPDTGVSHQGSTSASITA